MTVGPRDGGSWHVLAEHGGSESGKIYMRTVARFVGTCKGFADVAVESEDTVERVATVRRNGGNGGNEGWWEVKMAV